MRSVLSEPPLTRPRRFTSFPPFYFSDCFFRCGGGWSRGSGASRPRPGLAGEARAFPVLRMFAAGLPRPPWRHGRVPSLRRALATIWRERRWEASPVCRQPGGSFDRSRGTAAAPRQSGGTAPEPAASSVRQSTPPSCPRSRCLRGEGSAGRSARVSWAVKRAAPGDGAVLGSTHSPGRAGASRCGCPAQTSSILPAPGATVPYLRGAWQTLPACTHAGRTSAAPARGRAGGGAPGRAAELSPVPRDELQPRPRRFLRRADTRDSFVKYTVAGSVV